MIFIVFCHEQLEERIRNSLSEMQKNFLIPNIGIIRHFHALYANQWLLINENDEVPEQNFLLSTWDQMHTMKNGRELFLVRELFQNRSPLTNIVVSCGSPQ